MKMNYFVSLVASVLIFASVSDSSAGNRAIDEVSEVNWQQVAQKLIQELDVLKVRIQQQQDILDELSYLRRTEHKLVTTLDKESSSKASIGRTCEEIYAQDATKPSGNYNIDPDGPGGDEPFTVYCDMQTRTTMVGHDSETPTRIDACPNAGCYSKEINYNTSIRQLEILTQLSASCQQYIRFNCLGVPFEFNGMPYAFWNNRNGEERVYWAGRNLGLHTCRCGLEKNCNDTSVLCNCDALSPEVTFDEGYVTEKNDLPVMKLNFGRSSSSASLGIHTLGKFECSGRPENDGFTDSCTDLWEAGVQINGFYTLRKRVEGKNADEFVTSYCDFSKLPGDSEQEIVFGSTDVKSTFVYFLVKDNVNPILSPKSVINFIDEELDYGDNVADGVFTAPVSGFYFITFEVNNSKVDLVISTPVEPNPLETIYETSGSFSAVLELQKDATVSLTLASGTTVGAPRFFSGFLLKEILTIQK